MAISPDEREPTTDELLEQLRYALNHGNPDNTVNDLIHTLDRRIQGADE